ncbi:MAG TPA: integrase [Clostridiales bacterium]|nr:MAG: integrase [Clostridiales bacterium GWD2_32_59]HAN09487.1 integrase [Clostridiales bacterium]
MNNLEFKIDNFMLYCTSKNLSKGTMKSYEQTLKLFILYMKEQFKVEKAEEIETGHIRQYIKYLKERGKYTIWSSNENVKTNNPTGRTDYKKEISPATINNYIRNIKVFINFLYEENEILNNPVKRIEYVKAERKMKATITSDEFKQLIKAFDNTKFYEYRNQIVTILLLDTGCRLGECLALMVEDIDLMNRVVTLKRNVKNNKPRNVYFSFKTASKLRRWMNYKDRYVQSELLFPTNRGTHILVTSFEKQLKDTGRRVGLEVHPHQLRNNFARYYMLNGGDIYTLSKILGHSSIQVTETCYMDLTNDEIRKKYIKHSPLENWSI